MAVWDDPHIGRLITGTSCEYPLESPQRDTLWVCPWSLVSALPGSLLSIKSIHVPLINNI